jgi:hypothetical protein
MHSGIRDNKDRGSVGDFLRDYINPESRLSIVSAYFTIYAYYYLKEQLDQIKELRFLFGEPNFVLDDSKTYRSSRIEQDSISLSISH